MDLSTLILPNFSLFPAIPNYVATVQISQAQICFCSWSKFFSNRVVDIWNRLPDCTVTAESVYSFKRRLNCFDFSSFISYQCIFLFREPVSADCCQPWRPCLTLRTFIACSLLYVLFSSLTACGLFNKYHIIPAMRRSVNQLPISP